MTIEELEERTCRLADQRLKAQEHAHNVAKAHGLTLEQVNFGQSVFACPDNPESHIEKAARLNKMNSLPPEVRAAQVYANEAAKRYLDSVGDTVRALAKQNQSLDQIAERLKIPRYLLRMLIPVDLL